MAGQTRSKVAYGLSEALPVMPPQPIVAKRAPATNDFAPLGTLWIQPVTAAGVAVNSAWVLTSIISNLATWQLIEVGGGAGVFASLTVTPGPISLTGTTSINITGSANTSIGTGTNTGIVAIGNSAGASAINMLVGTGNFSLDGAVGSTYTIGASTTTGTITIGGTAQTGTMTFGSSSGTNIVNVGTGAGATTVNIATGVTNAKTVNIGTGAAMANTLNIGGTGANVIAIGNTQSAGSISLGAGMISGTISLGSTNSGLVAVPPKVAVPIASPAVVATNNTRVGYVSFTGFTTAAGATETFTISNSSITATSAIIATATNFGANAAYITVVRVLPSANSVDIVVLNNGAAALNGDIAISYWVLS